MIFKNSNNALLFRLIIYDFFSKYNRTGIFNQSEIGNEHAVKQNVYQISEKFRFGRVKIGKIK